MDIGACSNIGLDGSVQDLARDLDGNTLAGQKEQPNGAQTNSGKPTIICFSHLRWDFVWQRPQHLLTRAIQHFDVWFVEEPMFRPTACAAVDVSTRAEGLKIVVPLLPEGLDSAGVALAQGQLLQGLFGNTCVEQRVLWYYTPMAVAASRHLERSVVVYDNMDELSAFRGAPPDMLAAEDELFREADVVFTGGLSLFEAKRGRHSNVHAFPSSIDANHFGQARALRTQPRQRGNGDAPIRVGFFGVIDERMDTDLVRAVAALRPNWLFDMVGPVVKIDPSTLPERENLRWSGPCDYRELPRLLSEWDVGFMPFARNESTRFISPTKTPEFLAAGLPLVSTPITDVVRMYGDQGLVECAQAPEAFVRKIEAVLDRPYEKWLAKVDRHLAGMSWDQTWDGMFLQIRRASLRKRAARVQESVPASVAGLQHDAMMLGPTASYAV